jgi:hypothetical protein
MKHTFKKPYTFEGKEYAELEFDIEAMSGADYAAAKKQFAKSGNFVAVPNADSEFCACLLSRICKLPLEFFEQMPVKEYCKITQEVSNFLLA